MDDLDSRAAQALAEIDKADTLEALDALRVGLLGKSGIVTAALKALGALAPDERKTRGAEVNRVKDRLADALAVRKQVLEQAELPAATTVAPATPDSGAGQRPTFKALLLKSLGK